MNRRVTVVLTCVLASFVLVGDAQAQRPEARGYSYAYYLFLVPPAEGCESCYVPMLLTSKRLEEMAQEKRDQTAVVITTYERDSIVRMERGLLVSASDVKTQERHVRLRGRAYRYQEVSAAEVLRLLEHPEGTIPIHRTVGVPKRAELEDLIASFGAVK